MTGPREVDPVEYAGAPVDSASAPPVPVPSTPEVREGPPDGWLGDLIQAWFEARATAGLSDHGLVALHQDGLLGAAWRDSWTPHRSGAITQLERTIEGWTGLGPALPGTGGWRHALITISRAVAAIRAAWGAYASPVSVVRGSRPTLLPTFHRRVE